VAGVALGVAVVLGVDLAGASARRAFDVSTEMVMGRATHQVLPRSGRLEEGLYPELRAAMRRDGEPAAAAPAVEGALTLPGGRRVVLVGLDPFVEAPFRDELTAFSGDLDLLALLTTPGAVALPAPLAEELGVGRGDRIEAVTAEGAVELLVAGRLEPDAERAAAAAGYVFADIATAQELLGMTGALSRIDLIVSSDAAAGLAALLPGNVELVESAARSRATFGMTRAFRLNLTALSLLALLVGAFLIYSTMNFLVVRRTRTIGILRSSAWTDAAWCAPFSRRRWWSACPAPCSACCSARCWAQASPGWWCRPSTTCISGCGSMRSPWRPGPSPRPLRSGSATLLAALGPALEAASIPPRAVLSRASMERRTRRRLPWLLAGAGVALVRGGHCPAGRRPATRW
jgi:putative ABC transport system permease protein